MEITSLNFYNDHGMTEVIEKASSTPVFGMERCSYPGLYTGNEEWSAFNETDFMKRMDDVYYEVNDNKQKGVHQKYVHPWFKASFLIQNVAKRMRDIIDAK